MEKVDLNLLAIINRLISDFSDPSQHYLILANYSFYFDELTTFAPVYFNKEAIDEIQLTDEGLKCKFLFENKELGEPFIITIPYDQIGRISKCDDPDFVDEHVLFLNENVMHKYQYTFGAVGFYDN